MLTDTDQEFLTMAVDLSQRSLVEDGKTPFGALVVVDGTLVGRGTSSVVELNDATAHAEVMAIRDAGRTLSRHLMPDAVMYASSEPCPMCLIACYWARIPRIVYAATSVDVGTYGFEDLWFYRELAGSRTERSIVEDVADSPLRDRAVDVLRQWAKQFPGEVYPKI